MVGGEDILSTKYKLEDLLTEKQVFNIVKEYLKDDDSGHVVKSDINRAADGLTGFLGDHLRATLHVATTNGLEKIHLFFKHLPLYNKPKADFIRNNNFFKREALMFKLIKELRASDNPKPWCTKAFVYNESLLVMPDLRTQGYNVRPQLETLDLAHALVTVTSVARFHAATANFDTKRIAAGLPVVAKEHAQVLEDNGFKDTPWLRCGAKVTANLLNIFSKKYNNIPALESKIITLYLKACSSFTTVHSDTLNVLIHKDLWVNNIMYRYEQDTPVNALLIDFQCLGYGPPAFDLTIFLHCTTSRRFRDQFEKTVLKHYYAAFVKELEESTKQRLQQLGYDEREFLRWYEVARMFGALVGIAIFPYILMDPVTAKKIYDDPETYDKYLVEDRAEPVVSYCHQNSIFRDRQLELIEEFVERYMDIDSE